MGVWGEYLIEKESLLEKETLISKTKAGGQFPTQYMLVVNRVVLCRFFLYTVTSDIHVPPRL